MIATIAHYSLREAGQNRLLVVAAVVLLAAFVLVEFIGAVALTERGAIQAALGGALVRVAAIAVAAAFVTTSLLREQHEANLDLIVAMDRPRWHYIAGKLVAYAGLAAAMAAASGALLSLYAAPRDVAFWSVSLACEIWLVAAVAATVAMGVRHAVVALVAVAAFYLLSRAMGGLLLLLEEPVMGREGVGDQALAFAVEGLAWLLPALYRFTSADWLSRGAPGGMALALVVTQTLIYVALAAAVAAFDLQRRDF
jgi:hypothetical protein